MRTCGGSASGRLMQGRGHEMQALLVRRCMWSGRAPSRHGSRNGSAHGKCGATAAHMRVRCPLPPIAPRQPADRRLLLDTHVGAVLLQAGRQGSQSVCWRFHGKQAAARRGWRLSIKGCHLAEPGTGEHAMQGHVPALPSQLHCQGAPKHRPALGPELTPARAPRPVCRERKIASSSACRKSTEQNIGSAIR